MGNVDYVEVLHRCLDYFSKFDFVDRQEYFVNRLLLAQLQHSFEKRDFKNKKYLGKSVLGPINTINKIVSTAFG